MSQADSKPAGFSEEEKIKILLAEYTSLRSELNARLSSMYTVAVFSTVAITWFVSESREHTEVFWGLVVFFALGIIFCGRQLWFDTTNAGHRVQEIEQEVNDRAGERLLLWENDRGGLSDSYWPRFFFLRRPFF